MTSQQIAILVFAGALAAYILRRSLWRAMLFVWPEKLQIDAEEPPGQTKVPERLQKLVNELERLGFVPVGSHSERAPLAPTVEAYDFADPAHKTFATAFLDPSDRARVYFLSVLASPVDAEAGEQTGFVITANYHRPARDEPGRYVCGWLEDIPADRVFKAHLRRTEGMELAGDFTQEGRVAAARSWYARWGKSEVRQQHVQGLLWTLGSLGMVAALIVQSIRRLG